MITEELKDIPLDQIFPSPTNPRKTFDAPKLQELADSISSKGLVQPIVVRPRVDPNPNTRALNGSRYEIVAGERRYRAHQLAGLHTIRSIVRDLDDVAVLELQIIENNQRDDVHPLEEAEGYVALMKAARYDAEQIAAKVGRSPKYVYDRIKLLQLIPELKKAFVEGEITAGHAILLARLAPEGQRQVLGVDGGEEEGYEDGWHRGGLFKSDYGSPDPVLNLDDDEELEDARKAVSVRELDTYIREHVRLRPEAIDLPNLFPETAAAIEEAEAQDVKVVHITYEYRVTDSARDEAIRTYGEQSWKRADGEHEVKPYGGKGKKSKTCDHSVLGLVVAGPGQGQAFRVCIAKKKCTVHWADEMKAAEKRKATTSNGSTPKDDYAEQRRKQDEQWKREEQERARWKKAAPALLKALAEKLGEMPALDLIEGVINACKGHYPPHKQLSRGTTLEDGVRFAAFQWIARDVVSGWNMAQSAPKALRPLGIDAKKIVDEVAPKPKPEKKTPEASAAAKPKKKGARARRRETKAGAK